MSAIWSSDISAICHVRAEKSPSVGIYEAMLSTDRLKLAWRDAQAYMNLGFGTCYFLGFYPENDGLFYQESFFLYSSIDISR